MRHAFKIPDEIKIAVKQHVRAAIDRVSPERYCQESPYTAALLNRLEGRVYDRPDGLVIFESTIVDDRGRNSAESEYGADFAITGTISDTRVVIKKAILGQAKRAPEGRLTASAYSDLSEQIHKMRRHTRNPQSADIR